MRTIRGRRLAAFAIGLHALTVGGAFALGYLGLRWPNARAKVADPRLEDVVYDVPNWLLEVGLGLLAIGAACVLAAWYTSPEWSTERPLSRRWAPVAASAIGCGWVASVVAVIVGRRSGEFLMSAIMVVTLPLAIAIAAGYHLAVERPR